VRIKALPISPPRLLAALDAGVMEA
jgi:hypothetical protein